MFIAFPSDLGFSTLPRMIRRPPPCGRNGGGSVPHPSAAAALPRASRAGGVFVAWGGPRFPARRTTFARLIWLARARRGNTVPEMTGKWFTWGDAAASRCYRIVHHAREIARWIRCSRPISGGPIWGMRKGRGGDEAALPRSAGDARISNNIETGMTMAAGQKKTAPKRGATNARRGRPPSRSAQPKAKAAPPAQRTMPTRKIAQKAARSQTQTKRVPSNRTAAQIDPVLAAQFESMAQELGQIPEIRTELKDLRRLVDALTGMVEGLVANQRAQGGDPEPEVPPRSTALRRRAPMSLTPPMISVCRRRQSPRRQPSKARIGTDARLKSGPLAKRERN